MNPSADRNFILQQGAAEPAPEACAALSSALRVQPRLVFAIAFVASMLRLPEAFALLALALLTGAVFPRWNPFDALYRRTLGARPGAAALEPAKAPRRFSQALAASFNIAIALTLWTGHDLAATVLMVFLLVASAAVGFARLCFGSFLYHGLRGRLDFALRTLPWARTGGGQGAR